MKKFFLFAYTVLLGIYGVGMPILSVIMYKDHKAGLVQSIYRMNSDAWWAMLCLGILAFGGFLICLSIIRLINRK